MPKITPFLWYDGQAEEAAKFYVSIFKNSRIKHVSHVGDKDAPIVSVTFELDGQEVIALDGGPQFQFTEAVSLFVTCKDQREVDEYWTKLTADGGEESMCGWLKDKFGLSWQIIPSRLMDLLQDPDPERAGRATQAMLKMQKIDIGVLEQAARR